eukprot:Nitzschia sp. Nitz4//scaffold50_size126154//64830//65693//NITZ4_003688-RA/size126154-processed-gene-0.40-mRNA-1//1//CDS//3329553707//2791//frame0
MYHDFILEEIARQQAEEKAESTTATDDIPDEVEEEWPHSKVKFDLESTSTIEVPARGLYTPTESQAVWYQKDEYAQMLAVNRSTVKLMAQFGTLENEPDHCFRGLECKLPVEAERIRDLKIHSIYAVLKEQSEQYLNRTPKPRKIAKVYKETVVRSVTDALERGMSDEQEAQNAAGDGKKMKQPRRMSRVSFDDMDLVSFQYGNDAEDHDGVKKFESRQHGDDPSAAGQETDGKLPSKINKLRAWMKSRLSKDDESLQTHERRSTNLMMRKKFGPENMPRGWNKTKV